MNNFFNSLYKFRGITTRKQYWRFMFKLFIILFGVGLIIGYYEIPINGLWMDGLIFSLNLIFLPAMLVRRLNDCMLSPWLAIIGFIPLISLPAIILLGCIKSGKIIYVSAESI